MPELSPGVVFEGYRVEELAGRGGMGVVYRATQLGLGRTVALKLIAPELAADAGFRERFKRESQVAASIDHPNVLPVYEAGEADGCLFISMRYVPGTDLRALIGRDGRLEPTRAVRVVTQVAAALDAAHRRGLVHRDVKPANVLITHGEGDEYVYLTDFGLTKRMSSASGLTRTGHVVGTIDYMAPEQIMGARVDARTDVYALGCVLYDALTGQAPYERDSDVATMYAHLHEPPPALGTSAPGAPPALAAVVEKAMAKDPDERYPSAGDMGRAARAALEGLPLPTVEGSVATGLAAPGPASMALTAAGAPKVRTGRFVSARASEATEPAADGVTTTVVEEAAPPAHAAPSREPAEPPREHAAPSREPAAPPPRPRASEEAVPETLVEPPATARSGPRRRLVAFSLAALVVGLGAGLAIALSGGGRTEQPVAEAGRSSVAAPAGVSTVTAPPSVATVTTIESAPAPAPAPRPPTMSEGEVVDEIASILAYSAVGRRASVNGDFGTARVNRAETVGRVRSLRARTRRLGRQLALLERAAQASLDAVEAYQACGGAACAPAHSESATAAKEAFVAAFNPLAVEHLGRTYDAGSF